MSRKALVSEDDELDVLAAAPGSTLDKMPTDISGGRALLTNCFSIPVDQLVPFSSKDGMDFSRLEGELEEEFIDSVRTDGVIELLTVRPKKAAANSKEKFEILSGETRWRSAKAAGLKTVPCQVLNVTDEKAHKIFSLTNLFRRDMKPSDKVRGYYHYYKYMIEANQIKELQKGIQKKDVQLAGEAVEEMSYRQLMYYVAMTKLIPEWLARFDKGTVSVKAGSVIAAFPEDIQRLMLPYPVTENSIRFLKDVYSGKNKDIIWSENLIQETLEKRKAPKAEETDPAKAAEENHFRKVRKHIIRAVHGALRPTDYDNAQSVISEALKLYYEKLDNQTI